MPPESRPRNWTSPSVPREVIWPGQRHRKEKFTGRLRHCRRMNQTIDLILGMTAAVATALLMGLIARDNIEMPPYMVREDALIAASIMIAAVAGIFSRKPKQ
jgi:hypothetical protein